MHKYNIIMKYANIELINKCEEKKDILRVNKGKG